MTFLLAMVITAGSSAGAMDLGMASGGPPVLVPDLAASLDLAGELGVATGQAAGALQWAQSVPGDPWHAAQLVLQHTAAPDLGLHALDNLLDLAAAPALDPSPEAVLSALQSRAATPLAVQALPLLDPGAPLQDVLLLGGPAAPWPTDAGLDKDVATQALAHALDGLDAGLAGAIRTVLEAYVLLDRAWQVSQGGPEAELAGLVAASNGAAAALLELQWRSVASGGGASDDARAELTRRFSDCAHPFIAVDLVGEDSTYQCNAAILIDVGGDDTYYNNGGAGGLATATPVAILVDFAGNDRYLGPSTGRAANGAGANGVGLLLDYAGDDRYDAHVSESGAVNGGALLGVGTLVDVSGDDWYRGSVENGGVNGGAYTGVGRLLDGGGNDTYDGRVAGSGGVNGGSGVGTAMIYDRDGDDDYLAQVGDGGANGGTFAGQAILVDGAGNDLYRASLSNAGGANGGASTGEAVLLDGAGDDQYHGMVNATGAVNGAGTAGSGVLVDLAGNDLYHARLGDGSANGGASAVGAGLLVDLDGHDRYDAHLDGLGAVNGGAWDSTATLIDWAGDDHYLGRISDHGGINGGALTGSALLIDVAGSDHYHGHLDGLGGVNGGAGMGSALLVDGGGDNRFIAHAASGASMGAARGASLNHQPGSVFAVPGGIGILVAGDGDDYYEGTGVTQGAASQYATGVLIDAGGPNHYVAKGASGLAQGSGATLALGVLIDHGASRFHLGLGMTGQASALQGVGFLLTSNRREQASFDAEPGSFPGHTSGGGTAIRLSLGPAAGWVPDVACASQQLVGLAVPGRGAWSLCSPDPGSSQPLRYPFTGDPMPAVPKPPAGCNDGLLARAQCADLFTRLLGQDSVTWLDSDEITMTASGGLLHVSVSVGPDAKVWTQITMPMGDRACQMSCQTIEGVPPVDAPSATPAVGA